MDQMTEPTRQPRPFDDPDTDEFAVEYDETWTVDQSPDKTQEPESSEGTQGLREQSPVADSRHPAAKKFRGRLRPVPLGELLQESR